MGKRKLGLGVLGHRAGQAAKVRLEQVLRTRPRSSGDHYRPVLILAGWGHVGMLVPPQAKVGDPAVLEQQTLGPLRESGGHGAGQMERGE